MKFCRSCGSSLGAMPAGPAPAYPQPAPGRTPTPGAMGGMPPAGPISTMVPTGGVGGGAMSSMAQLNPMNAVNPMSAGAMGTPPPTLPPTLPPSNNAMPMQAPHPIVDNRLAAVTPVPLPYGAEVPPTLMPGSPAAAAIAAVAARALTPQPGAATAIACPRCGMATPVGFVYCQACGLHIQAIAPTDPGANPRLPSGAQPAPVAAIVDPQGATMAVDGPRAAAMVRPLSGGVAWGSAVLVNRDGSDGERYKLDAEYTVIGRAGADIAFDEDRFLARQHARLERGADGVVRVTPTDALNGVFRKTDAPVELVDGTIILVGREVLRFEHVDAEERTVHPLIRHGVALFGSPPREPWGRLLQILPSGGYRDIRHLSGPEVVLGREEGDIIYRDDAFMSRRHAAVTWDGKVAKLTDLGSSNGTFVRLSGATPIKHGDHLRLGDQLLRIELGR